MQASHPTLHERLANLESNLKKEGGGEGGDANIDATAVIEKLNRVPLDIPEEVENDIEMSTHDD